MNFTAKAVGNATVAFSSGEAIGGADGQQIIATSKGSTTVTMAKATTTTTTSNNNANTAPAPAVTLPKDPVLTKLEYALEAVLDDTTKQAKGIIFSGTADADTKINIVIASDPITSSTQSDASGNWTYTMVDWLPAGNHTIAMIAEKNDQKSAEAKTNFVIGTESKDQIAIGTELPAVAVAQPATNTKSKWTISTMMMIAGGIILILIVVLLVIFIKKRRKYLSVAKEISGSIKTNANKLNSNVLPLENSKPNQDLEAPISEPESNVQPLESSGEAVKPNPNVVPDNQPMTMPKDIPLPGEPKIPETTTPQESTQTTITSPPPSIQTSNIKPDSDKMIIGYGPDSGSQKAAESPKAEPAEIVQTPENKTPKVEVSPDSEITFDGDYDSNEVIEQDNVSKKSQ
jgi:Sec-independent protein translocase protein TatA